MSSDVFTVIVAFLGLLLSTFGCVYISCLNIRDSEKEQDKTSTPAFIFTNYQEYSTPKNLASIWFDSDKVGACRNCGGDDVPLLTRETHFGTNTWCKWCSELAYMKNHLKFHTTRVKKTTKYSYLDMQ